MNIAGSNSFNNAIDFEMLQDNFDLLENSELLNVSRRKRGLTQDFNSSPNKEFEDEVPSSFEYNFLPKCREIRQRRYTENAEQLQESVLGQPSSSEFYLKLGE